MDLSFKLADNFVFNARTSVIIRYQDNYLVSKKSNCDYYSLPGGRIKLNEDSKSSIIREIKEELGWDLIDYNITLLEVVENFFSYSNGDKFHEYLFIYVVDVSKDLFAKGNFINLENPNMTIEWYKKEDFLNLNIKPDSLKNTITSKNLKHLIIKE